MLVVRCMKIIILVTWAVIYPCFVVQDISVVTDLSLIHISEPTRPY